MSKIRICEICGESSENKRVSYWKDLEQTLCVKHYKQISRHGKTFRTIYDANEIIIKDGYAEILLYNIEGDEVARALISLDKVNDIKLHKWHLNTNGYVATKINNKKVMLHRFVYGEYASYIDHISGNKLDNRNDNLRECNMSQNIINTSNPFAHNTTSGVKGVIFDKERRKWRAEIQVQGKKIHIGRFDNLNDAKIARRNVEEGYFGEFAPKYTD